MATSILSYEDVERRLVYKIGAISGTDTEEGTYNSIRELWKRELAKSKKKNSRKRKDWYSHAFDYWEDENICPATDDGVLQGFGHLTEADSRDSNIFLDNVLSNRPLLQLEHAAGSEFSRLPFFFLSKCISERLWCWDWACDKEISTF